MFGAGLADGRADKGLWGWADAKTEVDEKSEDASLATARYSKRDS